MASIPSAKSSSSGAGPALVPMGHHEGKAAIRLSRPVYIIGSRSSCRIHLVSSSVSKAHALLVRSNGRTYIRDLASRSKVYINGEEAREAELSDGDLIKIGTFTFQYRGGPGEDRLRPTRKHAAPAKFEVSGAELPVPLDERVLVIGRRSRCDIHLLEDTVSTSHAVIFEMDGQRYIRDLGSRTGTYVNGVSTHQHMLTAHDTIRVGDNELRYVLSEPGVATVVEEEPSVDVPIAAPEEILEPVEALAAPVAPEQETIPLDEPLEVASEVSVNAVVEVPAEIPVEEAPAQEQAADVEDDAIPLEVEPVAEEQAAPEAIDEPIAIEEIAEPIAVEEPAQAVELTIEPLAEPGAEETIAEETAEAPAEVEVVAETLEEPVLQAAPPPEVVPVEMDLADQELEPLAIEPSAAEETPAQPLELALNDAESVEASSTEEQTALPLADIEPVVAAQGEPVVAEPELALPEVAEQREEQIPEPALDLAEPDIDVPAPVVDSAEIPLETVQSSEPEPLATIEAAAHEDLPLDTPATAEADLLEPVALEPDELTPVELTPVETAPVELTPVELEPADEGLSLAAPPSQELSAEPVLPHEPLEEVIESTEPTPQSALESSADQLALDALAAPDAPLTPPADALTDTQFDRAVREFSGNEFGDLVEPAATETATETTTETPVPTEEPELRVEDLLSELPAEEPAAAPEAQEASTSETTVTDIAEAIATEAQEPVTPDAELPEPQAPVAEAEAVPATEPPPPAPPRPRIPWGANQDNFLGGAPLALKPSAPAAAPRQAAPPAPAPAAQVAQTPPNERAVQDHLIKKLDQVAATAQAASVAPPPKPAAPSEPPVATPVLPPRPRRQAPRTNRRKPSPLIQAEQTETPERDLVNTGFDGLAHSPLRDMDVFSHHTPRASDETDVVHALDAHGMPAIAHEAADPDHAGGTAVDTAVDTVAVAHRPRVTPALNGSRDDATGERRPQVAYAAEMTEAENTAIRRRYHRRIYMLLVLMFVLLGGSLWLINNYFGAAVTVEGTLRYLNMSALTTRDRLDVQRRLLNILEEEGTLISARRALPNPEIGPGFLGGIEEYMKVVDQASFSESRPDMLVIRVTGRDPKGDTARMKALLAAQYQLNQSYVDDAKRAQRALQDLNSAIAQDEAEVERLSYRIAELRLIDDSRPTGDQISNLKGEVAQLEQKWKDADKKLNDAEAELERLKTSPTGSPGTGGSPPPVNDDTIRAMEASLTDLQKKLADSKAALTDQATAARRALDGSLEAFQQQVASAQGMLNGSPALTAYIQDAQRLQETTKMLTDELIRRQEAQVARLIELKERQSDRMEQRRIEIWQGDQQLREFAEKLAIAERQYNAAVGGGLQKEAEDKKAEVELIRSMIKARQALLPGDTFYADTIKGLQEIIDSTRKDIVDDRRRTEDVLAARQQAFVSSQAVRGLPEEQRLVAAQLQEKLQQVTDARKQYNQAIDVGTTDGDAGIKSQMATLHAAIDARRTELAEAGARGNQAQQEAARQALIQPKQDEVSKLKEAEAQASAALFEKHRELREAEARVTASSGNAEKLSALVSAKDRAETQRRANVDQIELRKKAVAMAIEPIAPGGDDVREIYGNDQRILYMGISSGGILLIFSVLIVLTLHAASVEAPASTIQAADIKPGLEPSSPANGEAHKADKSGDDEEDHEAAVV